MRESDEQAGYNWLLKHCAPFSGGGPISALSYTGPTPSAVLGARQLAPADVAADAGFSPCPTGMGPSSRASLSLPRARGSLWWRPLQGALKGITLASRPTSLLGVARVAGVLRRSKGHACRPCVECAL